MLDMSEYEVSAGSGRHGRRYNLGEIQIGGSRLYETGDIKKVQSIRASVNFRKMRYDENYVTRVVYRKGTKEVVGLMVWRVE